MYSNETPTKIRQLKLTDVLTDLEIEATPNDGRFINSSYSCGAKTHFHNEWRSKTEIDDCSRADIARSYRLGRGF
jgi:hypothetical protein